MSATVLAKLLAITTLSPVAQTDSPANNASATTSTPTIAIKLTAPTDVVFVEHVGPYWSLGPVFTRVGALMASRQESGSMFARYDTDPTKSPPSQLRTEVGFVVHGGPPVAYPFKRERRRGETVAYTVVVGPYATVARHYATIFDWLDRNGYEAIGPVTEIYPAGRPGLTNSRRSVVIQVPIVVPAASAPEPIATQAPARGTFEPTVVATPTEAIAGRPPIQRSTENAAVPTTQPIVIHSGALDAAPVERPAAQQAVATEPAGDVEVQTVVQLTIPELVTAEQFDEVAQRLMPAHRAIPPAQQVWFGQVVLRVAAVGRGVAKVYPNSNGPVEALSRAVELRYLEIVDDFEHDPRAALLAPPRVGGSRNGAARQRVTKDLDTLLGRISVRRADPDDVTRELATALKRIARLLAETDAG
ncbi:MAG: GyrI-like domain-containing protein [Planctomycetes bacterium]|nr:GyrI-like domain-containing protein [Planctomycetota bacterium]